MTKTKKRQKFFDVEMPIIDRETQLYGYDLKELSGKIIKYDLTRILRGKSIMLRLKVEVKDDKAIAHPISFKIMPFYMKRIVRKGTNYIEDSFSAKTKDALIKIKPFLVTRRKVSKAVRKTLREKAKEEIKSYLENQTTEQIFEDILKNKIQRPLSLKLKKIYPLSICEIRVFEIEKHLEEKQSKSQTQGKSKTDEKHEDKKTEKSNKIKTEESEK